MDVKTIQILVKGLPSPPPKDVPFDYALNAMKEYAEWYYDQHKASIKYPDQECKKVLFLDDCNKNEWKNPNASLVQIPKQINTTILSIIESTQIGVGHRGGYWREIMEDGKIHYTLISQGKKSDYTESDYDEIYQVISGNY